MKIEIWSDVACPFCYIGKRHLEKAMKTLPFKDELEIIWKSYQLNPSYQNTNKESIYDHLANSKGISIADAKQMTGQVAEMASKAGLSMNFDRGIPANTFDAHRLIHFAATHKLQGDAKEALLKAYFMDGKDVADKNELVAVGETLGLEKADVLDMLQSEKFAENVKLDIKESQDLGVQGVPFFVLDRKYAISGAQPVQSFIDALKQSFEEWKEHQQNKTLKPLNKESGAMCDESGCEI
ncbi:putative DsbA family dithiol-disulfide isomerase [Pedobacter sp. UYP30]|uniref:DsbA family oxidoreductase n=1 Tax=Pedobacter sp. UYP30 TaxID=1756400 RepID=UPI0033972D81